MLYPLLVSPARTCVVPSCMPGDIQLRVPSGHDGGGGHVHPAVRQHIRQRVRRQGLAPGGVLHATGELLVQQVPVCCMWLPLSPRLAGLTATVTDITVRTGMLPYLMAPGPLRTWTATTGGRPCPCCRGRACITPTWRSGRCWGAETVRLAPADGGQLVRQEAATAVQPVGQQALHSHQRHQGARCRML